MLHVYMYIMKVHFKFRGSANAEMSNPRILGNPHLYFTSIPYTKRGGRFNLLLLVEN
jgi:hypothetical protein